jgi:hypothetical protein
MSSKYVSALQDEMAKSKTANVHVRMAQYLLLVLTLYPPEFFTERVGVEVLHNFLK